MSGHSNGFGGHWHTERSPSPTISEEQLGFIRAVVRSKARQLIRRASFLFQDQGDLEQELLARVLRNKRACDSANPRWQAFVIRTVNHAAANIVRDRKAAKRRVSQQPYDFAGKCSSWDALDRISARDRSHELLVDIRIDIRDAIDCLPRDLQKIARRLKSDSISELARKLGIPRTTIHDQVRLIRQRFEEADLREYL